MNASPLLAPFKPVLQPIFDSLHNAQEKPCLLSTHPSCIPFALTALTGLDGKGHVESLAGGGKRKTLSEW